MTKIFKPYSNGIRVLGIGADEIVSYKVFNSSTFNGSFIMSEYYLALDGFNFLTLQIRGVDIRSSNRSDFGGLFDERIKIHEYVST